MENIKPCVEPKMLINALGIIDKFNNMGSITDIEFVSSDNRAMSRIIKLGSNVSEDNYENWNGEYFTDYDLFIALYRGRTFTDGIANDKYCILYGNLNSNSIVDCENKEDAESKYKQIKDEELLKKLQADTLIQQLEQVGDNGYTYQSLLQEYDISDEDNHIVR